MDKIYLKMYQAEGETIYIYNNIYIYTMYIYNNIYIYHVLNYSI